LSIHPRSQRCRASRPDWNSLRVTALPAALVGTLYGWAVLASTVFHPGWIGPNHIAPGTDWMVFYGSVTSAVQGSLSLIMNGDDFTAFLNRSFQDWLSAPIEFRPWFYPPSFLVLLLPFAPLGFAASYVAFQILTAAFLATALIKGASSPVLSRYVAAGVLISPAAAINIVDGQCAFLVAALLIAGVRLLPLQPILGGILLGLLSFKPQFCLLVPVALVALRQYKALLAAAGSALALVVLSVIIFGLDVWLWWIPQAINNFIEPDAKWLSYGRIWGHSVWACAVLAGIPPRLASVLQIAAIAGGMVVAYLAFRSTLSRDKQLAVLLAATVLAAPHSGAYDATLLAAAVGLWLAANIKTWRLLDWFLALGIWMVPILSPPTHVVAGRFSPLLIVALIGFILHELRGTSQSSTDSRPQLVIP
jgi:Glycosyltransferase family 87